MVVSRLMSPTSAIAKTFPYLLILYPSYVEIVHAAFLFPTFPSGSRLLFFYLLCVTLKRFLEVGSCLKQCWICVSLVCPNNFYQWILCMFYVSLQFNNCCYVGSFYFHQSSSSIFSGNTYISMSALGWHCPWMVNIFHVFLSNFVLPLDAS
jgi:hypothetical protein